MSNFRKIFKKESSIIDTIIKNEFKKSRKYIYGRLYEAMEYSLFSGGKRVRPVLLKWCAELGNPEKDVLNKAVAAIEYIHTYSLIHDDLPAMDDDDRRRGLPTSHIKFGEAIAILAGDALLTQAFFLLGQTNKAGLVRELAKYAGPEGMVGGQAADIEKHPDIRYVNELKTACLFKAAAVMGGIAGGFTGRALDKLADYGINLGRAFQLRDDQLDHEAGDFEKVKKESEILINNAKKTIKNMPNSEKLAALADYVIIRKK